MDRPISPLGGAQPSGRAFQGPAAPCSGPGAPPALPPRRVARAARAREFPEDVDERLGSGDWALGTCSSTSREWCRYPVATLWPIGTALAQAPDRSRRRPGAVLHFHTVDLL